MALYGGVQLPGAPDLENVRKLDLLSIKPISRMQRYGFAIDIPHFQELSLELAGKISDKHRAIISMVPPDRLSAFVEASGGYDDDIDEDSDFNPDSGKQMAELLFNTLEIGKGKKLKTTKSGAVAVDKEQLENLKSEHPIVQEILDYRGLVKLKGTYVDKLPRIARFHPRGPDCPACGLAHNADTQRVHTQILATRTGTGRLACVASWTPVITSNGATRIEDLSVGAQVWTHKARWRSVTAKYLKGVDRMYHVRFSNGEVLTCTADHKLLLFVHECEQVVGKELRQSEASAGSVSYSGSPNHGSNSGGHGDNGSECWVGSEELSATSRIQSSFCDSLLQIQAGREEPTVRYSGRSTSEMDWSGGRWVRVFDLLEGWEKAICPPDSNGDRAGSIGFARGVRCASYRRGHKEQRSGQPGVGNEVRSPEDSYTTGGFAFTSIEEINFAGSLEVYDISVEEDESYLACGVFSHNSKNPNQQNIPARSELGRKVRAGFIPSPGTKLVANDFSQIELRMLAHIADETTMLEVYRQDGDIHNRTACGAFGIEPHEVQKLLHRPPSKIGNFSIVYQVSPEGFLTQLRLAFLRDMGLAVPSWVTLDWVKWFIGQWHKTYYKVQSFTDSQTYNAHRYGIVWTLAGRVRRIPEVRSVHKRIQQAGIRQAGNVKDQGSCADLMRLAMAAVDDRCEQIRAGGYWAWPLLTVHDELILEVEEDAAEAVQSMMQEEMNNVAVDRQTGKNLLLVPIKSDGGILERWEK